MSSLSNEARRAFALGAAAFALIALTDIAGAQVTPQQQSAIKSNCTSDFMSKCSGVTPGSKDALACLQTNVATLSPACQTAIRATMPATAPASTQTKTVPATAPTAAQKEAMRKDCVSDYMSHCANVAPGSPDALACLQRNAAALSAACKQIVSAISQPAAASAPAATTVATPASGPTTAQKSAMKQACQSDFMAHCRGVSPGGQDAFLCLQRNAAALSPGCKQAVGAIGQSASAPATATAAPAAAAAPAAGPTPQQMSALKHTCGRDFMHYCRGVTPGGPDALTCLQRNAARLTPDCKTSLADIAQSNPAAGSAAEPPVASAPAAAAQPRPLPPGITPAGRIMRRMMERNAN